MKNLRLDLDFLYPNSLDKNKFLSRFDLFMNSDNNLNEIIKLDNNNSELKYRYNELLCSSFDKTNKSNLILVFGNPSPHSIKEQIMFSYEGANYHIHRVWKVLQKTGIINLEIELLNQTSVDYQNKGTIRNNLVREGLISNNFNLSMLSFYSFPSASSDIKWSGVAGIKKLFGHKAWIKIEQMEKNRFTDNLKYLGENSKIIVFQIDAYNNIDKNTENLDFKLLSPTRLWYSEKLKQSFVDIVIAKKK